MSAPEDWRPPVLSASPQAAAERFGIGAVFCLSGLGIAAAATILAFFGTGLLLLVGRPADIARTEPLKIVTGIPPSAPAMRAVAVPPSPVLGAGEIAGPPARAETASASVASPNKLPSPTVLPDTKGPIPPTTSRGTGAVAAGMLPDASDAATSAMPAPEHQADATALSSAAPLSRVEPAASPPGRGRADATAGPIPNEPLPATKIKALLVEGDAAFRRGDLPSARLLYRRAYEAGDGRGALGIGASYDPLFLRQFGLWTQISNPDEARLWYVRARNLGEPQAENRIKRLSSGSTR